MRRTYYRTCEYCGCTLDPEELCDCQTQEKQNNSQRNPMSITTNEILDLMMDGLIRTYQQNGEKAVKDLLHIEA